MYAAITVPHLFYLALEAVYDFGSWVAAEEAKCLGHVRIAQFLYSINLYFRKENVKKYSLSSLASKRGPH